MRSRFWRRGARALDGAACLRIERVSAPLRSAALLLKPTLYAPLETKTGGYPAADGAVLAAFPLLAAVLPAMHEHAAPRPAGATVTAAAPAVVDTLDALLARVAADASFWCDGLDVTSGAVQTPLENALLPAGELAALLAGRRGVALLQLFNGWDRSKGQPVYTPFALTLLERALAAPGVGVVPSVAPRGAGLTAVLYADREPFASYARHLASFGCQV